MVNIVITDNLPGRDRGAGNILRKRHAGVSDEGVNRAEKRKNEWRSKTFEGTEELRESFYKVPKHVKGK